MPGTMEELVAALAEQNKVQQIQITSLVDTLKQMPGIAGPIQVAAAAPDPAAIRADKVQRIALGLRKSNRIKDFKHHKDSNIRIWIKKFEEEIKSLKTMIGIDSELTRDEYVPLFRGSLEYNVVKRVNQVFKTENKTWETITKDALHKLMIAEFGIKHTDVASVLSQFGPSRLSKSSDQTVSEFYYDWHSQIPNIMKPSTDDEYKNLADLILRAMFYISLNDKYLQQALSDLKDDNPTLKTYLDEAVSAESKRKCFQDIAVSSSSLDSSGGVTISKWDTSFGKDNKSHQKNQKGAKPKGGDSKKKPDNDNSASKKDTDKNQKQNPKKKGFCKECKIKGHYTNDCWKLKAKLEKKQINNVTREDCNDLTEEFGA